MSNSNKNQQISDKDGAGVEGAGGVPVLKEVPKSIDRDLREYISEEIAKKYKFVPFEKIGNVLKVAMVDPGDFEATNLLRFVAENKLIEIEVYQISPEKFSQLVDLYIGPEEMVQKALKSIKGETIKEEAQIDGALLLKKQREVLQDAPVAKLVQVILKHAIDGKASDIHIEPMEKDVRVRYRLDGILHNSLVLPKEIGPAVVSRVKILSNLKIDEKRKPQDGRFSVEESGRRIDFRVSSFPVVDGEKIVMRILDKSAGVIEVEKIGVLGTNLEVVKDTIREPFGIVLITGPTGSGKSTTLYAFLRILNREETNIITLEDPVEYYIEGLNQSQIKPEIGYTFASGLRSILRQDPNIIMVGEIRDSETAELATHAALTGHLVFSTIHTNTALGAIPRLVDMGIEPFLISSSLRLVIAQRLIRRVCDRCKAEDDSIPASMRELIERDIKAIPESEVKKYGLDLSKGIKFYKGKGCEYCNGTGLKGRIALFDMVKVDDEMQQVIVKKGLADADLEAQLKKQGLISMKQDGLLKIALGITTLTEVERVTEGSLSVGGAVEDDKG